MATTEWVQKAGQSSDTDVDNISTLIEQAETAATNAETSETNAATSATNAATSASSAATSATNASTSATSASTSATTATTKATEAATSATNAATSETNASTSATNAATSETNAATSATNAATSATNAATSESNASTSATNAENAYDSFDDRFLGAKASDPTLDNDGDALITGALYFNTTDDKMKVYNGSAWQDVAPIATSVTVSQITDLTATATELNYVDGVTSSIQTQLDAKAPSASPTLTGTVSFSGGIDEAVYNLTGTALDPANGTIQYKTLSANTTLTDSLAEGESMTLMIDDGSAYTITWPTTTWVNNGGSAPTLATTGYTVIALWKVSTTLYGALVGDGS